MTRRREFNDYKSHAHTRIIHILFIINLRSHIILYKSSEMISTAVDRPLIKHINVSERAAFRPRAQIRSIHSDLIINFSSAHIINNSNNNVNACTLRCARRVCIVFCRFLARSCVNKTLVGDTRFRDVDVCICPSFVLM